ncbi:fumarylacetoacetate hydrolase family protein [Archaeoglobus veneficus]|uniref:Ureidoglycolate lyase n=1 Tax=Archaeoglobus veneficus (strain DSM 11195 / SNP6) TaxID=693661 RepID=F2KRK0_ARCVS|nr:fumarylacetoacetate hydrolase family protein [Archaeoglobus veneficus]AEA46765.1 Ureidoglycolate lyase [Archaeoglobus veneficus SNP6]
MKAYGRFIARGELCEGYFDVSSGSLNFDGIEFPLNGVKFLPPVEPSKIVCVGLNYIDHARELNMEIPEEPVIFMKPSTAIIGHEDFIELPPQSSRVDYEGELAVVIGRKCRNVSSEEAYDYVMGYTCFNDVTARDLQQKDGQWTRSKSFDTFAPIGPYVVSLSPSNLKIETRLNGKTVQSSTTSNLIFDVPKLIEFISSIMTLKKHDVIATGTPAGVGKLNSGDVVEIEIEGIGVLRNYVR